MLCAIITEWWLKNEKKYLKPNFIVSRQKELITLINKTLAEGLI